MGNLDNKQVNRQQDYIPFLEQTLNACDFFREKYGSEQGVFFFCVKDRKELYNTRFEGWGNLLSACVYEAIRTGKNALKVSTDMEDSVGETFELKVDFSVPEECDVDLKFENKVNEIMDDMRCGFTAEEIVSRLARRCEDFLSTRRKVITKKVPFYLLKEEIDEYLESYYNLLNTIMTYYERFDYSSELINVLLQVDTFADERDENYKVSFWSPIALNKVQKVNRGVEEYFQKIAEKQVSDSKLLQRIYKRTFLTKAKHLFRWYITDEKRELRHVAMAPYVEKQNEQLDFSVIARKLEDYNSYERIKELRLGEKIIQEYKNRRKKEDNYKNFNVVIIGDIYAKPLKVLQQYIAEKYQEGFGEELEKEQFKFRIYTKNTPQEFAEHAIKVTHEGTSEEILSSKELLGRVIEENDAVFILDCVELYERPKAVERENLDSINLRYAFSEYDETNTGSSRGVDICEENALDDMYAVLTGEQCFGKFGRLEKRANEALLQFCEQKQRERKEKSVIYVYVSDLKAFGNIYNDDQYYVRTERYNEKEIGIIRYSSEEVKPLPRETSRGNMLVFTLWQFVRNVAVDEKKLFAKQMQIKEDEYAKLGKIHIGIDYKKWPDSLELHYYIEKELEISEESVIDFINKVLVPILNNRSKDMFNVFIKRAMCSFFYGSAKDVNDMLFVHLFKDKEKLLGKAYLARRNDKDRVDININRDYKYSIKRFYDMIMKNYDISSSSCVVQTRTYQIIKKSEKRDERINRREIYENVIKACEALSYNHSYLATNCEREL